LKQSITLTRDGFGVAYVSQPLSATNIAGGEEESPHNTLANEEGHAPEYWSIIPVGSRHSLILDHNHFRKHMRISL